MAYDYLVHANKPMRDPIGYFRGPKSPRLLNWGPIAIKASDWLTGRFESQKMMLTLADTDHTVSTFMAAHSDSLMNSEYNFYLVSDPWRLAGGKPRLAFQGLIEKDDLIEGLRYQATVKDYLGFGFSLLRQETMVPQWSLEEDFPGFGLLDTDGPTIQFLTAPLVGGVNSDEAETTPRGRVPIRYVGTYTYAGTAYAVGVVAGHACAGGIFNVYDENGSDPYVPTTNPGTNIWFAGGAGWAGVNPDGAALYTTINGRWYTLVLVLASSTLGDDFSKNKVKLWANTNGFDYVGDGTGAVIEDIFDLFYLLLTNFFLRTPTWQSGPWLASPQFDFGDGSLFSLVDISSWYATKVVAATYLATWKAKFVLGVDCKQEALRDVIARFCVQGNFTFCRDEFQRYRIVMLDRRLSSYAKARAITYKHDTLASRSLSAPLDPNLTITNMRVAYDKNYRTGKFEKLAQAGAGPFAFGNRVGTTELWDLIGDDATATALGQQRIDFRARAVRVPPWRETNCGLKSRVGDVVKVTHYIGPGSGYSGHHLWIRNAAINQNESVDFEAYDVHGLLS